MPPLDYEHPVITATQSLATGHLRVSLLVEASLAHPSFLSESPLSDLRENAMETLPAVLAKEAPSVLRQILQAAEAQLLSRTSQDVASTVPFVGKMVGAASLCPHCPHCRQTVNRQGAKQTLTDLLGDWVKAQTEPFSLDDAANALGLSEEEINRDVKTRIGTALRRLGCKRTATMGCYSFTQDSQPHTGPQSGPFEERSSPSITPSDQPRHQHPTHQSDPVAPQPDGEHPVDSPSPKPTA